MYATVDGAALDWFNSTSDAESSKAQYSAFTKVYRLLRMTYKSFMRVKA